MSNWTEIKDGNDVSIDNVWGNIHILYGSDDFGNNYISVPVEFITGVLIEAGYDIQTPPEDE